MVRRLFYALSLVAATYPTFVACLWPAPASFTNGTSYLKLSSSFSISYAGSLASGAPSDLKSAVSTTISFLKNDNLQRLILGQGATDVPFFAKAKTLSKLTLSLNGKSKGSIPSISQNAILPLASRDESYTLKVPADGSAATITANTTVGLYRGLTTFTQLWYTFDKTIYTFQAPISIVDAPAFPFRGFMLDTARNFFPVADIKRTIDAMSWTKINTLHWHVVDSQSFPLQIPGFIELSQKGAYDASSVYSPADVAGIVSYAGARGIDVVVEIDTPGHTSVISKSHPDFIACAEATPWASFANEPPAGQLRLANSTVISFVQSLFTAVADLFPSKYISTGGDEINANCYNQDAETQSDLKSNGQTFEQALDHFVQSAHQALAKKGKTPVVWEEMIVGNNVTLPADALVMVWISSDDVAAVAQQGFSIVHAASDFFYLDCGHGGWVGNFPTGNSWCDPYKTWQKIYTFDPYNGTTSDTQHLVKGGEALLWSEQSGPENLDDAAWPRGASAAEVFWTGAEWNGAPRNIDEALPRLHDWRYRAVQRGVNANHLQPKWCALRPGVCDLTA